MRGRHSLYMTNYSSYPQFFVSVDCVVFGFEDNHLKVLIHKRPYDPGQGELSLIGGFVERNENLETAALRILAEFTGLDDVYMKQIAAFGEVERDPGERVISIVYGVLLDIRRFDEQIASEHNAEWVEIDKLPQLCFDHNEMVSRARQMLIEDIKNTPVAGRLLPRYFTITNLQTLYEAIIGQEIDKRNFRRSLSDKPYIHVTNLIDKMSSRRGAKLYEFDL